APERFVAERVVAEDCRAVAEQLLRVLADHAIERRAGRAGIAALGVQTVRQHGCGDNGGKRNDYSSGRELHRHMSPRLNRVARARKGDNGAGCNVEGGTRLSWMTTAAVLV